MAILNYLFCLLLVVSSIFPKENSIEKHEFHISKCLIEYNEKTQSLEVTLHLFIDDLEEALRQQGADNLFICTEQETETAEQYIYNYLQQKLELSIEDQAVAYQFIGKEISEDMVAVWCYLEVEGVQDLKQLKIKNGILLEVFDDQKNIISVIGPQRKKGYLLFNRGKDEDTLTF